MAGTLTILGGLGAAIVAYVWWLHRRGPEGRRAEVPDLALWRPALAETRIGQRLRADRRWILRAMAALAMWVSLWPIKPSPGSDVTEVTGQSGPVIAQVAARRALRSPDRLTLLAILSEPVDVPSELLVHAGQDEVARVPIASGQTVRADFPLPQIDVVRVALVPEGVTAPESGVSLPLADFTRDLHLSVDGACGAALARALTVLPRVVVRDGGFRVACTASRQPGALLSILTDGKTPVRGPMIWLGPPDGAMAAIRFDDMQLFAHAADPGSDGVIWRAGAQPLARARDGTIEVLADLTRPEITSDARLPLLLSALIETAQGAQTAPIVSAGPVPLPAPAQTDAAQPEPPIVAWFLVLAIGLVALDLLEGRRRVA